jgi:hypothetical protein
MVDQQLRVPGKRGRLSTPASARFILPFIHHYAHNPFPAPTYPVDVTNGVTAWGMLGNGPDPTCTTHPDGVGDCTFAGRQHYRMAKAAKGAETETWETADQLVAEYLTYDGGQDQGANIPNLLLSWFNAGTILAFAPVDHTDPAQVDAAMALFNGVYVGVQLTDDADDLFAATQPWTIADGQQADPDDGHCIVKVKAQGPELLDGYVTWGAEQPATTDWSAECVEEAWIIITSEDTQTHLIDLAALRSDITALGGHETAA